MRLIVYKLISLLLKKKKFEYYKRFLDIKKIDLQKYTVNIIGDIIKTIYKNLRNNGFLAYFITYQNIN